MRNRHIIAICLLMAGTACSSFQEGSANTERPEEKTADLFYATLEQNGAAYATKVYADENLKVLWNADDRISIFNKYTYGYEYAFQGASGKTAGTFAKVATDAEFVTGNPLDKVYAVYPYSQENDISNDGELSIRWPSSQTYKPDSFGIGSNVMVSVTADNQLRFKNIGGYLAIKLYGENVSVTSITLKGNNGEKLSGKARVSASEDGDPTLYFDVSAQGSLRLNCTTPISIGSTSESATVFWLVVPPTQFTQGFNITVHTSDGGIFVKSTDNSYAIERNTLCRMAALEVLATHGNPWEGYTEESRWGLIGHIVSTGNNWGFDEPTYTTTDGNKHVARNLRLEPDDTFKFRLDHNWETNWGAPGGIGPLVLVVGQPAEAMTSGGNYAVPATGFYDILLDEDEGTITLFEAYPTYHSWGIIGLNGDWENDILATEDDGVWTAYITAVETTTFKWRKDGDWDENYGGTLVNYGEYFEAVADGIEIAVSSGFYKVVLDLTDVNAPTIAVINDFEVWSLIGDFNSWSGDVNMVESNGLWIAEDVELTGEWKIRKNHAWYVCRGGTFAALGEPFSVVEDGNNINCGTGTFNVVYNPAAETITVTSAD